MAAQTGLFAEATRRAAEARFKQRDLDAEGQEIDVNDCTNGSTKPRPFISRSM